MRNTRELKKVTTTTAWLLSMVLKLCSGLQSNPRAAMANQMIMIPRPRVKKYLHDFMTVSLQVMNELPGKNA